MHAMNADIPSSVTLGAVYEHYKGSRYTVLSLVTHHETRLPMVVYRSHERGTENCRPLHGWAGDSDGFLTSTADGKERFVLVKSPAPEDEAVMSQAEWATIQWRKRCEKAETSLKSTQLDLNEAQQRLEGCRAGRAVADKQNSDLLQTASSLELACRKFTVENERLTAELSEARRIIEGQEKLIVKLRKPK